MSDAELEPHWKCVACLDLTPKSTWNESDGLCRSCWDGEWPRGLSELPPKKES